MVALRPNSNLRKIAITIIAVFTGVILFYAFLEIDFSGGTSVDRIDVIAESDQKFRNSSESEKVLISKETPKSTSNATPTNPNVLTQKSISLKKKEIPDSDRDQKEAREHLNIKSKKQASNLNSNEKLSVTDLDFYSDITVEIQGEPLSALREQFDSAIGASAPLVKAITLDGDEVYVGGEGYFNLIIVLAHWCPHCRNEVRELTDYLKEADIPGNLKIYSLATSIRSDRPNYPPHEWFESEKWPIPVIVDNEKSDISFHYGVSSYPFFILIDDKGKILSRKPGRIGVEGFQNLFRNIEKIRTDN